MVEGRINLLCGDLDAGLEGRVSSFDKDLVEAEGWLSMWKDVDPGISVLAGFDVMPGHEALVWTGGGRISSGLNGLEHVVGLDYARKGVGVASVGIGLEGSEDVVKSLGGGGDLFHHFGPGLGRFEHWGLASKVLSKNSDWVCSIWALLDLFVARSFGLGGSSSGGSSSGVSSSE